MSDRVVPKAVKDAEARAEAAHKAMYGKPQDTEPKEPKAEEAKADEPTLEEQPERDEKREAESTPQAQTEPQPEQGDEWKRKYDSLKGKYDAEIPRLAADLRELRKEKQEMERQLQELQNAKASAPEGDTDTTFDDAVKRLVEEYGQEFYDLVRQVARKEVGSLDDLETVRKDLEDLKQDRQMSKRERFDKDLKDAVPDWEQINVEPKFHSWLAETDPFTGEVRQTLLDRAAGALNANRVAAIFDAFKGTLPKPKQPAETSRRPVSPPRGGNTDPEPPRPQYTISDWNQLQDEARRGKWRHRMDEFRKREQAIHAAITGQ